MQIIGFNFENISGEIKKPSNGKFEVNVDINVLSVSQENLDIVKDKPVLKFVFEFSVNYKPELAKINLKGSILAILNQEQTKEILKTWKSEQLPEEVRLPLFNLILSKCTLKALQLEEELSLPTHIPLPRLLPEDKKDNKAKYTG